MASPTLSVDTPIPISQVLGVALPQACPQLASHSRNRIFLFPSFVRERDYFIDDDSLLTTKQSPTWEEGKDDVWVADVDEGSIAPYFLNVVFPVRSSCKLRQDDEGSWEEGNTFSDVAKDATIDEMKVPAQNLREKRTTPVRPSQAALTTRP